MPRGSRQHALELRIPPLLFGFSVAALMWFVSSTLPTFWILIPARRPLAVSLATAGVIISSLGVESFWRARTTVNPMKPSASNSLVMSGVYGITRNPMYVGFLLLLVGWAIFLSNVTAFGVLPLFILYMNRFQIEPEERALAFKFGQEFIGYKSRVRRWL